MIPWTPQLPAHTGGKPWKYKTSDGVIRDGAVAVEEKTEESAGHRSKAGKRVGSALDEADAEDGALEDELAPRVPKASKHAGKGGKHSAAADDEQPSAADEEAVETTRAAATKTSRRSQRGDGGAEDAALDESKQVSSKRGKGEKTERATDETEEGESEDLDFDSALDRRKSTVVSKPDKLNKSNKSPNKSNSPNTRNKSPSHDEIEGDESDASLKPSTRTKRGAHADTTKASRDKDDAEAAAAADAEPTPKSDSEEELTVAGVIPPVRAEPRRTRGQPSTINNPPTTQQKPNQPKTGTKGAATQKGTDSSESDLLDDLLSPRGAAANQSLLAEDEPVSSAAGSSRMRGKPAGNKLGGVWNRGAEEESPAAAAADEDIAQNTTQLAASAELNDTLSTNETDYALLARGDEIHLANSTTDEIDNIIVDDSKLSTSDDERDSTSEVEEPLGAPLAGIRPISTRNMSSANSTAAKLPGRPNKPQVDMSQMAGGGGPFTPPDVVKPTPRRGERERPSEDEKDGALEAADSTDDAPLTTEPADTDATYKSSNDALPKARGGGLGALRKSTSDDANVAERGTDNSVPDRTVSRRDKDAAAANAPVLKPTLGDVNRADLPLDITTDSDKAAAASDTSEQTDADAEAAASAADLDAGTWKKSTATSSTSFLRRSFTAGFVLCVVIGCVVMIGRKVKETLDSHEDEGSEGLLAKMETGQGSSSLMSTGVLSGMGGGGGGGSVKKDEDEGRPRVKPAIVEDENEEDRYQQQQSKLRAQAGPRGMSLTKQPLPPAAKKPSLAVQQVDEEDTSLAEDDEPAVEEEEEVASGGAVEVRHAAAAAAPSRSGGDGFDQRRERKTSDDGGWESF